MWPFRRKNVAVPLDQQDAILALTKEIAALRASQADLQDEFHALDHRYDKLRARFYNTQRGKPDEDAPPAPERMTRDQLKRHMAASGRFIPGKAPVHTD